MLHTYKELTVWQKSIELVMEIYRLTDHFPKAELYGLTSQMRRAVVSIPSNIAEGYMRGHRPEYIQFIRISFSSGAELETQLIISEKLELTLSKEFGKPKQLLSETMKMLNGLLTSLVAKP